MVIIHNSLYFFILSIILLKQRRVLLNWSLDCKTEVANPLSSLHFVKRSLKSGRWISRWLTFRQLLHIRFKVYTFCAYSNCYSLQTIKATDWEIYRNILYGRAASLDTHRSKFDISATDIKLLANGVRDAITASLYKMVSLSLCNGALNWTGCAYSQTTIGNTTDESHWTEYSSARPYNFGSLARQKKREYFTRFCEEFEGNRKNAVVVLDTFLGSNLSFTSAKF